MCKKSKNISIICILPQKYAFFILFICNKIDFFDLQY